MLLEWLFEGTGLGGVKTGWEIGPKGGLLSEEVDEPIEDRSNTRRQLLHIKSPIAQSVYVMEVQHPLHAHLEVGVYILYANVQEKNC